MFLYETDNEADLRPLKFIPPNRAIEKGILLEESTSLPGDITPEYVEYYINFLTDNEIPNEDICRGIHVLKTQNVELDLEADCPDTDGVFFDIYGTRAGEAAPCPDNEECD